MLQSVSLHGSMWADCSKLHPCGLKLCCIWGIFQHSFWHGLLPLWHLGCRLLWKAAAASAFAATWAQQQTSGLLQPASALCLQMGWLKATRADLVVSDTVPLACAAAKLAGVPCVCISNFSWGEPTPHVAGLQVGLVTAACSITLPCVCTMSLILQHATNSWGLPLVMLSCF